MKEITVLRARRNPIAAVSIQYDLAFTGYKPPFCDVRKLGAVR